MCVCWSHCWVLQICWHIESNTFTASSFRIWNSSTGIPWLPLALFVVMLSKAHLTSHSKMSGSRWVITPLWLSVSWRWAVATGLGKVSFHSNPKKGNAKECSNYHTIALISHASKVMLKILQARLQQYVNFQMFKLDVGKAEEPEIKLSTSAGSWKKQMSSRKTSISALLTMPKPLTVWITINCGKFWNRWEYQTTWPASWETCMQVRKQQLELDMEQQTGSK